MNPSNYTIVALATPPGHSAIAVVRVSGPESFVIAPHIFKGKKTEYKSHVAYLGYAVDQNGDKIDQVLFLPMKGPKSFTGEDSFEIHCHGSLLIVQKIIESIVACGAKMAGPGEFSFRAFMNGKIDLVQAESIQALIGSASAKAQQAAALQLEGRLSEKVMDFQKKIAHITAIIEAWVDYPEEGLEFASHEEIVEQVQEVCLQLEKWTATFSHGEKLKTGFSLCLLGPPNSGKSSLMNALLGKNKAIVTPIAGTTRDVLEGELSFFGFSFHLFDTAGVRETEEIVEKEGIARSLEQASKADLILLVLDGSKEEDLLYWTPFLQEKTILILNKKDLCNEKQAQSIHSHQLFISAKTGQGLDLLKEKVTEILVGQKMTNDREEIVLTEARHYHSLVEAKEALVRFLDGMQEGISPEYLVADLRSSLRSLGMILGIDVTEEVLTALFSKFCVGK